MDAVQKRKREETWSLSLNPSRRPSQSRKESILNCVLIGKRCFIDKGWGGIGSRWSDQEMGSDQGDRIREYRTSKKRVEYWREIKCGSENSGSLFRWTYYWQRKRKLNKAACLKRLWTCKVKNIVARKEGKRACTTIQVFITEMIHRVNL